MGHHRPESKARSRSEGLIHACLSALQRIHLSPFPGLPGVGARPLHMWNFRRFRSLHLWLKRHDFEDMANVSQGRYCDNVGNPHAPGSFGLSFSVAACRAWSVIVSGSEDGTAIIWDLNRAVYANTIHHRDLEDVEESTGVHCVAINDSTVSYF